MRQHSFHLMRRNLEGSIKHTLLLYCLQFAGKYETLEASASTIEVTKLGHCHECYTTCYPMTARASNRQPLCIGTQHWRWHGWFSIRSYMTSSRSATQHCPPLELERMEAKRVKQKRPSSFATINYGESVSRRLKREQMLLYHGAHSSS